jgi:hypothetical protein
MRGFFAVDNGCRHAFAIPRRDAPELCTNHSPRRRGRGECRAPNAPAASRAEKGRKHTSVVTTGLPETPSIPARNGFNSLLRALPGDRALLPPSPHGYGWSAPGRADFASARLDTSVEMSGPHDLTVRFSAVRQPAADRSRASRPALPSRVTPDAAASVTIARAPLMWDGTAWMYN